MVIRRLMTERLSTQIASSRYSWLHLPFLQRLSYSSIRDSMIVAGLVGGPILSYTGIFKWKKLRMICDSFRCHHTMALLVLPWFAASFAADIWSSKSSSWSYWKQQQAGFRDSKNFLCLCHALGWSHDPLVSVLHFLPYRSWLSCMCHYVCSLVLVRWQRSQLLGLPPLGDAGSPASDSTLGPT